MFREGIPKISWTFKQAHLKCVGLKTVTAEGIASSQPQLEYRFNKKIKKLLTSKLNFWAFLIGRKQSETEVERKIK